MGVEGGGLGAVIRRVRRAMSCLRRFRRVWVARSRGSWMRGIRLRRGAVVEGGDGAGRTVWLYDREM